MPSSPQDPFHRDLHRVLLADIDNRIVQLASGSATALANSPISTAETYAAQVSYIKALNDVLAKCQELEDVRYDSKPKTGE